MRWLYDKALCCSRSVPEFGKIVAASNSVALQLVCDFGCPQHTSLSHLSADSSAENREASAAGTWTAYNHNRSYTNDDDTTQFYPSAQRHHETSNIMVNPGFLARAASVTVTISQAKYLRQLLPLPIYSMAKKRRPMRDFELSWKYGIPADTAGRRRLPIWLMRHNCRLKGNWDVLVRFSNGCLGC